MNQNTSNHEYYNTTHLKGEQLKERMRAVKTQEKVMLTLFNEQKALSASLAHQFVSIYCHKNDIAIWPLTSTRRAITNLSRDGRVIKTTVKVIGKYGKPEYVYKLIE